MADSLHLLRALHLHKTYRMGDVDVLAFIGTIIEYQVASVLLREERIGEE